MQEHERRLVTLLQANEEICLSTKESINRITERLEKTEEKASQLITKNSDSIQSVATLAENIGLHLKKLEPTSLDKFDHQSKALQGLEHEINR